MKTKHTTNPPRYSFTTGQEGRDYWYQVIDGCRLLEGGYGRSRRDAAECARAATVPYNHLTLPTTPPV